MHLEGFIKHRFLFHNSRFLLYILPTRFYKSLDTKFHHTRVLWSKISKVLDNYHNDNSSKLPKHYSIKEHLFSRTTSTYIHTGNIDNTDIFLLSITKEKIAQEYVVFFISCVISKLPVAFYILLLHKAKRFTYST